MVTRFCRYAISLWSDGNYVPISPCSGWFKLDPGFPSMRMVRLRFMQIYKWCPRVPYP